MTMGSGDEGKWNFGKWSLCDDCSRSTKPYIFPCKVVAGGGDEKYLVCAAGAAAGVFVANAFLLCVLPRVAVPVRVVLCVRGIGGWGSHWNGCMIVVIWCCCVR